MRSRFPLILAGLVVLAIASLVMLGCSDDETPPTANNNDQHDALVLAAVTARVNEALDSAVDRFTAGLEVAELEDRDVKDILFGPIDPDTSETPEDNGDGWWVLGSTDLALGVNTAIVDSLQYLDGVTPQNTPVGADAMVIKHHYTVTNADTTVSYTDLAHDADLQIHGIDGTSATITGEVQLDVFDKDLSASSTVRQHFVIDAELSGITVEKQAEGWTTGCPVSGTLSVNVQYTYKLNSNATETINWQFDVTFTDGSVAVDVTNTDDLSTSYDADICTL
jgi:hypothetical protein